MLRKSVVAKNATTASDGKTYMVDYYNLDAIISIGYRVNSKRGTEFRIWATGVLKDHIVKGYTVNEKRLRDEDIRLKELQETVDLLGRIIDQRQLVGQEAEGLLKVVADYSQALKLLDDYDYSRLTIGDVTEQPGFAISYEAARSAIDKLASGIDSTLFGREKDDSFKGSIGAIYQTFDEKEVYQSIEEKAAHLLYFVIKNHSFVDGNKLHRGISLSLVSRCQWDSLPKGWREKDWRQCACGPYAHDCGKQIRRNRCDHQGGGESHQ